MGFFALLAVVVLSLCSGLGSAQRNATLSGYPLYMMQLYRAFKLSDSSPAFTSQQDTTTAPNSDSVLSLMAKDCHQVGKRWSITFDLSSVSSSERVLSAELRIRLPAFTASKTVAIDLYHSRPTFCPQHSRSCREGRTLLGTFKTSPTRSTSSWKVFNVSGFLHDWHDRALDWEASGDSEEGSGGGTWLLGETGQRKVSYETTNRVIMVLFSRQRLLSVGQPAYSLIQTVQNSKYVGRSWRERTRRRKRNRLEHTLNKWMRLSDEAEPTVAPEESEPRPLCRRVDMWVDFDLIGWDAWIVHPKRYNAYRCEGDCPTPLDELLSPTNHAYMQSLLRHHHPERVGCPSCVPTRLSHLSMLYYDNEDLALRHHDDMVVEECGCH
ncbi:southpaw [Eucyclogobius newberryi]|uniref:southpaw n=1 Tax=Eucyclogobius newberryi TaxID=166745 RepID=UPI003B5C2551